MGIKLIKKGIPRDSNELEQWSGGMLILHKSDQQLQEVFDKCYAPTKGGSTN